MILSPDYIWVKSHRRVALEQSLYEEAMKKFDRDLPFDYLFGEGITRIVLPYENKTKPVIEQTLSKKGPLGEKGYDRIDWETGEAIKIVPPHPKAPRLPDGSPPPPKEQRISLGKAFGPLPNSGDLQNWWSDNRETLKGNYSVVISRHPVDVLRMSDHRNIVNCHSPAGGHFESCLDEMKHGGLVAYVVKEKALEEFPPEKLSGEDEIFFDKDREIWAIEPLSRLRIRRYTHKDGTFDLAVPEMKVYGRLDSGFQGQITEWAQKTQEPIIGQTRWRMDEFVRRGGQYRDVGVTDAKWFNNFFGDDLDEGDTEYGVAGEESESINKRLREEMKAVHDRWQNNFRHCFTIYGEYASGGHELRFSWSGSVRVDLPEKIFAENGFDEIDDPMILNVDGDSLSETLKGEYFAGVGQITVSRGDRKVYFYVGINDEDRWMGGSTEYDRFCNDVSHAWDDRYDVIKETIFQWLLTKGFAQSSVREFSRSKPQFQNLVVDMSGGEMRAVGEAPIGVYDPQLWNDNAVKNRVSSQVRNLVSQELTKITQGSSYTFTGFDIGLRVEGATKPWNIVLRIVFSANDLTSKEDLQMIIEAMRVVDQAFPRIIAESTKLVESYRDQIRASP